MADIDTAVAAFFQRAVAPLSAKLDVQSTELAAMRFELAALREVVERAGAPAPERIFESPKQFARRLEISERTVRGLVAGGVLPSLHAGRRVRIPVREAEAALAAARRKAPKLAAVGGR